MNITTALTANSFPITGRGHIVELQHHEAGLPTGTVLTSVASGLSWEVRARILFDHATEHHTYFENEAVEFVLLRFSSPESLAASLQAIAEAEHRKLYRYLIQPIGHGQKPQHGEELTIEFPEDEPDSTGIGE